MPVEEAKGIPDRRYYGELDKISPGLIDFIIQRHIARRAGPHFDVRFGDPKGLFSWATRKSLPTPGGRILLKQQPMHSYKYKDFEGVIPEGYGAGRVSKHQEGQILVTKVSPGAIHFTTASQQSPERFALIRPERWGERDWLLVNTTPTDVTPYEKVRYKKMPAEQVDQYISQMQQGDSVEAKVDGAASLIKLLRDGVEVTSYRTSKRTGRPIVYTEKLFGGIPKMQIPPELVGTVLKGETYAVRPRSPETPYQAGTAERILKPEGPGGRDHSMGALARRLSRLRREPAAAGVLDSGGAGPGAEALAPAELSSSSQPSPLGEIAGAGPGVSAGIHEPVDAAGAGEAVQGDGAGGDTASRVLRVRGAGIRRGESEEVLGPQELGGILNSTIANAITRTTAGQGDVRLRTMLYDIQQHGKKHLPWETTPRSERRKLLEEVAKHLPPEVFHVSQEATTPEEARKLWEQVKSQQHPLTSEGIVVWPHTGRPQKAKLFDDYDVHISNVFPGEGKYQGVGAGGFEYALEPGGPVVGRVGTGFSDETRKDLLTNSKNYIGRVARIRSQEQFPTGAYRAPAFLALHEDYPTKAKIAEAEDDDDASYQYHHDD